MCKNGWLCVVVCASFLTNFDSAIAQFKADSKNASNRVEVLKTGVAIVHLIRALIIIPSALDIKPAGVLFCD